MLPVNTVCGSVDQEVTVRKQTHSRKVLGAIITLDLALSHFVLPTSSRFKSCHRVHTYADLFLLLGKARNWKQI